MKNLIPHFIAERFMENSLRGSIMGTTLFMDISGFTSMTSILMERGKEGAEALSDILNTVFTPIVKGIYRRGGFISAFAGDALTAIFPADEKLIEDPLNPLLAALEVRNFFIEQRLQKTRYGDFTLSIKFGLSFGQIDWTILGKEDQFRYFFSGEAIHGCAASERLCEVMEIVLDEKVFLQVQERIDTTPLEEGYHVLKNRCLENHSDKTHLTGGGPERIPDQILRKFVPRELVDFPPVGEFRNVVSVFLSFTIPKDSLNSLVHFVIDQAKGYGGYFNKIDFGDKGKTMLVFFGAPVSFENDMERAMNFVLSIREVFKERVRAGIAYGIAFFGPIGSERRAEYTCIGDVVNLSARFMMKADFNQVWVSQEIKEKTEDGFVFQELGAQRFKGKEEPIAIYELKGTEDTSKKKHFTGEMVGREKELHVLQHYCRESILQGRFGGIVYVYGEAGMGKSRLVTEALEGLPVEVCTLQTDSILKQSLNPFTYFLKDYFQQYPGVSIAQRKKAFDERFHNLLKSLKDIASPPVKEIQELERTPSFLGAVVGLYWEGSLYEELDAKGRQENTFSSLKNFFKALSHLQPVVLFLEDIHWIDPDSQDLLVWITRNTQQYPIIILATSRMNDDGTKPKLALEGVLEQELLVESLPDDGIEQFTANQLGYPVSEDLRIEIKDKSFGNPFYIEQFCLYLQEKDLISLQEGSFILNKAPESLPESIQAILMARIDRLSQEIKTLIQVASVLGREVDLNILFTLIQSIQSILRKDFQQSVERAQKEQIWSAMHALKYIFKHALLREVVYEMQLRKTLQMLHGLAAESMEKFFNQGEEDSGKIAFHYDQAQQVEKAIYFYEKASEHAKKNYQNNEALAYCNRLLALETDKRKLIEIQNKQGNVLHLMGEWDQAAKISQKSMDLAQRIGDSKLLAQSKRLYSQLLIKTGEYSEAVRILEEAKNIAETLPDPRLYGQILGDFGIVYLFTSDNEKALKYFEEYKNISLERGNKKDYSSVVGNMGCVFLQLGEYEKAMECFAEEKSISLEIGNRVNYTKAIGNMGNVYADQGIYAKALACYEEQKRISLEIGNRSDYSGAVHNIGTVYHQQRDYEKTLQYYEECKQLFLETGEKSNYSSVVFNLGIVYGDQGNYEKALEFFKEHERISLELGERKSYSMAIGYIGLTYYYKGDYEKALALSRKYLQICLEIEDKKSYSDAAGNIGKILAEKGEYRKSLDYFQEAIEIGRSLGTKFFLCDFLYNKGKTLLKIGEECEAEVLINEALSMAREINRRDTVFEATLIKHTLNKDCKSLLEMLDQEKYKEEEQAAIYYTLGQLTGSTAQKKQAIQLYKKLYQKTPKHIYKRRIDDLSNNLNP